ncbi:MAG: hypothetical protein ACYTAS_02415 [Planctomycetota bacterium]|jgi:hypothetical protein
MSNPRFSLEEFNALFPDKFASQEEMQKEYDAFLLVLEQLDQAPVPELSVRERAEIFRRSWPARPQRPSWAWTWLALWRRPAVTFALGLVLGCILMLGVMSNRPEPTQAIPVAQPFTVERTRHAETYTGKVLQGLYPHIENPTMVVEKTQESSPPRRVIHGTLDDGKIHVLWNL